MVPELKLNYYFLKNMCVYVNGYKYSGIVIFIQNIEEYSKILPPHSWKIKGIIVFSKEIDDVDFEFTDRISKLCDASIWLKENNPYYKNIQISENNWKEYNDIIFKRCCDAEYILARYGLKMKDWYFISIER